MTRTLTRNIELLDKTMRWILDHPELHEQQSFGHVPALNECGVVACYGGWAVMLSGMPYEFVHHDDWCSVPVLTLVPAGGAAGGSIREAAKEVLGLTDHEAFVLFSAANTVEELEVMVKMLVNGETLDWRPPAEQNC